MSLKNEFSKSFINSDLVLICPIYAAGEKKKLNYNHLNFAKSIAKNSKTKVIIVKNENNLQIFSKII